MPFRYTDEKIPKRPLQGGYGNRSVSGASDSRWIIISQEDLFTGFRPGKRSAEDGTKNQNNQAYRNNQNNQAYRKNQNNQNNQNNQDNRKKQNNQDNKKSKEPGPFSDLLRMTADYQVTEEGRRAAFLSQAKRMESYTEETYAPSEAQYHAFVGYQEMDARELHCYFAWRTRFRRGEQVSGNMDFFLLHAAELINLIGAEDERDAFDKLRRLVYVAEYPCDRVRERRGHGEREARYEDYAADLYRLQLPDSRARKLSEVEKHRLEKILSDFVISWGPDPEILAAYCIEDFDRERDNITLRYPAGSDDASIYRMISRLVERRTLNSVFLEKVGEDAWRVMARVFRRITLEHAPGEETLAGRLLGKRSARAAAMFSWIPYEPRVAEGDVVEVSPVTSYRYQDGKWYRNSYPILRDEAALRRLNAVVRECERVLRGKMHYRRPLPDKLHDPRLVKLIEEEYEKWMREKEARNRPPIHVDLSKLNAIREQAAITRERLLEGTEEGLQSREQGSGSVPEHMQESILEYMQENLQGHMQGSMQEKMQEGAVTVCPEAEGQASRGYGPGKNTEITRQPPEFSGMEKPVDESAAGSSEGIFRAEEISFLKLLLAGEDGKDYVRTRKVLGSVFVDAINEKAYDEIGDSIVESDGSGWKLVDDYIEDVKELLE